METILAIEKGQSFAKAAEIMHLTVPAITKTIKNLEQELGLAVLDRSSYRVELNDYGRLLASHARSVMTEIEDAKRNLSLLKDSKENQLRVSAAPALMHEFLPRAVGILRQRIPGALVHLNATNIFHANPINDLATGLCDLAISPILKSEELSPFTLEPLTSMKLDIIASKGHPAIQLKKPDLKQLNHFDWLFPSVSGLPFETIQTMFRESGATLPISIQAMPFRTMMQAMLNQGEYLAMMPSNDKLFTNDKSEYTKIKATSTEYGWTHYLMQRKNNTSRPIQSAFIEVVKELIKG